LAFSYNLISLPKNQRTVSGDMKVSTKASDLRSNAGIANPQTTSPQTLVANGDQPVTATTSPEPSFGSSFTIMPSVGTLGFGLAVATPINSNFQARVGLNYAGFGINSTTNDIKYDGNLNLFSATALVDYYPFGLNSFLSITGGLAYQNNRLSGKAVPNGGTTTVKVNNVPYTVPNDSSINGTFSFPNSIAPYIGIGFATQIAGGFGIYSNLGVMFAGTPKAEITASGSITNDPVFNSNLEAEKKKAQDEVNKNVPGIYPVLTFGLSYQF
ncbi:MAG: hypothetical protein WCP16_25535, partial [Pseudanabaena sp. ELA645]